MKKTLFGLLASTALATAAFADDYRPHTSLDEIQARKVLMKERLKGVSSTAAPAIVTGYETCAYFSGGKVNFATYCDGYETDSGNVHVDHLDQRSPFRPDYGPGESGAAAAPQ